MNKKSSSLHTLNADKNRKGPIVVLFAPLWFAVNWINNHWFPNLVHHLHLRHFVPVFSAAQWERSSIKSSPSRKLSDIFWMQLPWAEIQSALGTIHMLDVGCGSGGYYERLQEFSGSRIASYTGLDVVPRDNWGELKRRHNNVNFYRVDSSEVLASIPAQINLIISQSAVEHFEQDLEFFSQVAAFVRAQERQVLQVHLVPSRAGLPLYLLHGVRQYTPRTLSAIARLFHPFSYSLLYTMGGRACNRVHRDFITRSAQADGSDLRERDPQAYDEALRQATIADMNDPREPSFYALVIHSNFHENIFGTG